MSVKLRKEQHHRSLSFCMIHALYYNRSVRITDQIWRCTDNLPLIWNGLNVHLSVLQHSSGLIWTQPSMSWCTCIMGWPHLVQKYRNICGGKNIWQSSKWYVFTSMCEKTSAAFETDVECKVGSSVRGTLEKNYDSILSQFLSSNSRIYLRILYFSIILDYYSKIISISYY